MRVRGLSLTYSAGLLRKRRVEALRDISFEAHAGEIIGVVGPNGSGKSSLFRSLLGLEQASGAASVFGRPPGHPEVRSRIGSSADVGLPFPEFTAREFLAMHACLAGASWSEARERSRAMLERVGLLDAADQRHGKYSSGMGRRLALAQALLNEPELLLLDEPSANLDPLGIEMVADELRAYRDSGGCALVATHGLEDFEGLFSRLLVLLDGTRVAYGTVDEVRASEQGFALCYEADDREPLEKLDAIARERGLLAKHFGPMQRKLGQLLRDVQAGRRSR